jgi:hypothetical protein
MRLRRLCAGIVQFWHDDPYLIVLLVFLAVGAASAVIVAILNSSFNVRVPPPPFRYSSHFYPPSKPMLCPGDALEFSVELEIQNPPYIAVIAQDVERVQPDGKTSVAHFFPLLTRPVTSKESVAVAPNIVALPMLETGRYEYRRVTQAFSTDVDYFVVPFEVIPCDAK